MFSLLMPHVINSGIKLIEHQLKGKKWSGKALNLKEFYW